jgi:integrase/recombinase XerC
MDAPPTGSELVPIDPTPTIPALPKVAPSDLYAALLAEARVATTEKGRKQDVAELARFLGMKPGPACTALVIGGAGQAAAIATAFRAHLLGRGLAAATVNRRLSTVRRVATLAHRFGLIDWMLLVDGLKVESYRDTRGPGRAGWLALLRRAEWAAGRSDQGKRDVCIVRLLHDHGLRRAEVTGLDRADLDLDAGRLMVLGKGKTEKSPMTVNNKTTLALAEWIRVRGDEPGPLFHRLDRARGDGPPGRLDGDSIAALVRELGNGARVKGRVRPHGLRHQGITRVLELTNGNIDAAQKFARHADPKTTQRYNDNRSDVAGEMARLLGDDA